jgi:hypothetical protein
MILFTQKFLKDYHNVKSQYQKPIIEVIKLAIGLADVLEYIYNHLSTNFINLQLDNLNKQCLK